MDVKGHWQRWLKVRDLTKGVTYFFRVQARTITYGPELRANVTAGPAEGECTLPPGSSAPTATWAVTSHVASPFRDCPHLAREISEFSF